MGLLRRLGHDVKDVVDAGLKGCEDDQLVELAEREDLIIITHDLGFGYIYYFSKKGKLGIIVLRIHPPTVEKTNCILEKFVKKVNLEKEKLTKCPILLEDRRYRILR